MPLRKLILSLGLIVAVFVASSDVVRTQAPPRRNFVVIMVDDADLDALRTLIFKGLMPYTTHYLIGAGFNFTESFSVGAWGGPARASFLTGQYPHNHGELGNDPVVGGAPRFNQSSTLATWLRTAGYRTSMVGRYVPGYGLFTSPTFIPPGWDNWFVTVDPTTWSPVEYVMNLNGGLVDFGELSEVNQIELHQTDMIAYLASTVIEDAATRPEPFFLYVNPVVFNREIYPSPTRFNMCPDPADPFLGGHPLGASQRPPQRYMDTIYGNTTDFPLPMPASFNEADVSDKPQWVQVNPEMTAEGIDCLQKRYWRRLEAMRAVDDLVGWVMGTLELQGLLSNTVVFFTGDNGWTEGQHRFADKSSPYEESIRVPLVMRPATPVQPRNISRMVLTTDLAPTIAQLAGVSPGHVVDGRSLLPLLQNPDLPPTLWRKLFLLRNVVGPGWAASYPPSFDAVRSDSTAPRLYVRYPGAPPPVGELYDLVADPSQLDNRFNDPARAYEQSRLQLWLDAMKTCRGLSCTVYEQFFSF